MPNTTVCTTTLPQARDKVLFLYCYGSEADLEWTRSTSRAWAAEVLRLNPTSESTSAHTRARGSFVAARAAAMVLIGHGAALMGLLLSMLRKRQAG